MAENRYQNNTSKEKQLLLLLLCKQEVNYENSGCAAENECEQFERPDPIVRSADRWLSRGGMLLWLVRVLQRRRWSGAIARRVRDEVREDRAQSDLQEAARHEREERAGQSRVGAHQSPERDAGACQVQCTRYSTSELLADVLQLTAFLETNYIAGKVYAN